MIRVVLVGFGGHGRAVGEIIQLLEGTQLAAVIDPEAGSLTGVEVFDKDEALFDLPSRGITHAAVGLGSVGQTGPRERLFDKIVQAGLTPVSLVHPRAYVSPSATLGRGVTVLAQAVVHTRACLEDGCIVNTAGVVEHDCVIGKFSHIAPGAVLGGTVGLGERVHVGLGARVRDNVRIGDDVMVGVGSVVIEDVEPGLTVVGVPARPLPNGERTHR